MLHSKDWSTSVRNNNLDKWERILCLSKSCKSKISSRFLLHANSAIVNSLSLFYRLLYPISIVCRSCFYLYCLQDTLRQQMTNNLVQIDLLLPCRIYRIQTPMQTQQPAQVFSNHFGNGYFATLAYKKDKVLLFHSV